MRGRAGQGCELSPQLFSGVLEDAGAGRLAMPVWIFKMACAHSSHFRFADDIFFFLRKTFEETFFGDKLGTCKKNLGTKSEPSVL